MMKISKILLFSFCLLFVYSLGYAQMVKLEVDTATTMTVTGSSTLHDWTSDVHTVNGYVEVPEKMISKGKIKKGELIKAVKIIVPVVSIISPRGATMDKKTYNAFKSEEYPEIVFELKDIPITEVVGSSFSVLAYGNLEMAGVTKQVQFPVEGKVISSDKMSFTGAYKLNMTDYEMEPPSAMFGQIVTGEEVEIKFELIANR